MFCYGTSIVTSVRVIMATDNTEAGVAIESLQPTPEEPILPAIIYSLEVRYRAT